MQFLFQAVYDGLDLETEINKGLTTSLFSYKPCQGGFNWFEDGCSDNITNLNQTECSEIPFNQREPIRRTVQQFWNNNGMTLLNITAQMSVCPNGCSNRGKCDDNTGLCQCEEGFTGCDCSGKFQLKYLCRMDYIIWTGLLNFEIGVEF